MICVNILLEMEMITANIITHQSMTLTPSAVVIVGTSRSGAEAFYLLTYKHKHIYKCKENKYKHIYKCRVNTNTNISEHYHPSMMASDALSMMSMTLTPIAIIIVGTLEQWLSFYVQIQTNTNTRSAQIQKKRV